MSSFACPVARIHLEPHPQADRLEIGQAAGLEYQFVVPKGQFTEGETFVYIPEGAVLPEGLIIEMGLEGKLAGAQKNRVKSIKLRGVLSQGLAFKFYPGEPAWELGTDLSQRLRITKYEPAPPKELQGRVRSVPSGPTAPGVGDFWRSYDVENLKNHGQALLHGEPVQVTEKLHGSCTIVGVINGEDVVSSKGVAKKGFVLDEDESNTYWRIARQYDLHARLRRIMEMYRAPRALLFGEVLGVQDLMYGLAPGDLDYRAFDLYLDLGCACEDGPYRFLDAPVFRVACERVGIPTVPVLYEGPWDRKAVEPSVSGQSTLAGHIREGVVIKPRHERSARGLGRVALKWVSPDYLLRKDGSEFE